MESSGWVTARRKRKRKRKTHGIKVPLSRNAQASLTHTRERERREEIGNDINLYTQLRTANPKEAKQRMPLRALWAKRRPLS